MGNMDEVRFFKLFHCKIHIHKIVYMSACNVYHNHDKSLTRKKSAVADIFLYR